MDLSIIEIISSKDMSIAGKDLQNALELNNGEFYEDRMNIENFKLYGIFNKRSNKYVGAMQINSDNKVVVCKGGNNCKFTVKKHKHILISIRDFIDGKSFKVGTEDLNELFKLQE